MILPWEGGRNVRGGVEEQAHLGGQPAGDGVVAGEIRWEDRLDLH